MKTKEIITIKNLTKKFITGSKEIIAVNDLSFSINDGEFIGIIGRSGSGKSTLLYQLSLLDTPTSGEICISGLETFKLNESDKTKFRLNNFGYVFQDYALMPTLTALDNVILPILMKGIKKSTAQEMSISALEKVGLGTKYSNLPSQLSGGEQQRVSIARAIADSPKIIFADEPTANLDTETSEKIIDIFKDLNHKGQTIIMVTHELDYTQTAKRVIKMQDGKII